MLTTPARGRLRGRPAPTTLDRVPPLRALPIPVPLIPGEGHRSLLDRLARANHLALLDLRDVLPEPVGVELVSLAGIAALAGHPIDDVRRALDAVPRTHHAGPRLGCSRCLARRGVTAPAVVTVLPHQPLCRRHRRWLATPQHHAYQEEYDLAPVPEVLRAQRRHAAAARARPQETALAHGQAWHILQRWADRGDWSVHRDRRLAHFLDTSRYRINPAHPLITMVNYPETVTLARLLADPHWIRQATNAGLAGLEVFHDEVRRCLQIDYEPYHARDPLVVWREQTHRTHLYT